MASRSPSRLAERIRRPATLAGTRLSATLDGVANYRSVGDGRHAVRRLAWDGGLMQIDDWLEAAIADATQHGLAELAPLLESLARATRELRAADWNDDASGSADLQVAEANR